MIIALDILLDQAQREKAVDVYACVERLRSKRVMMVQTRVRNDVPVNNICNLASI